MSAPGVTPEDGIATIFERSRYRAAHTSAAAQCGFLLSLVGVLAAPFSVTFGLAALTATAGLVLCLIGIATTSRTDVAGKALVPLGLLLAVVTWTLLGMRYAGVDTAFGDALLPTLGEWLAWVNEALPRP